MARSNAMAVPKKQRALVLQGGGALGAYEAGVFKALYDKMFEQGKPLFDIVAGVSIGAVNSCLLVNHAVKNNGWQGSAKALYNFWDDVSTPTWWLDSPAASSWWGWWEGSRKRWNDYFASLLAGSELAKWREQPYALPWYFFWPDNFGPSASGEAARRYYSVWYFSRAGTPKVLSSSIAQPDLKFYDQSSPFFFRFDNAPLAAAMEKYWDWRNSPIKTSLEAGQPRLLLVSVDLQDSSTATFDSYSKKTEYGDDKVVHAIEYDGIGMQHLMTSMSSHLKYKYPTLQASTNGNGKAERHFWDGVYLSNTPLRELLQAHRNYWFKARGIKDNIPDLEIYIIDLYPTMEKGVPQAADEIQDRQFDILFHDKTKYDEKVARMVSDYIDMSRDLVSLAKKKGATQADIDSILDKKARSMSRSGINRQYRDLLDGRFEISKLVRIERSEDMGDDIVGKAFDFSTKTINQLRDQGHADALAQI